MCRSQLFGRIPLRAATHPSLTPQHVVAAPSDRSRDSVVKEAVMKMVRTCAGTCLVAVILVAAPSHAAAQPMTKARVADLIVKVENGVDDFRKYLEHRGENAKTAATTTTSGKRRTKTATSSQKATAEAKKDDLDDALGDLNRSTNRLRRKFDATDAWMETKAEVQHVIDDGRRINQVVARGSYGNEVARLWAALRTGMNDLARAYGVTPLGV